MHVACCLGLLMKQDKRGGINILDCQFLVFTLQGKI